MTLRIIAIFDTMLKVVPLADFFFPGKYLKTGAVFKVFHFSEKDFLGLLASEVKGQWVNPTESAHCSLNPLALSLPLQSSLIQVMHHVKRSYIPC